MTAQFIEPTQRGLPAWRRALDITAAIDGGQATPESVMEECLERIAQREPHIKAWAWHDAAQSRRAAGALKPRTSVQPLYGVPVGIKDIIDTADMPTGYGSALYEGHCPDTDATVVSRLRAAGAIIMGKTTTTEFAYVHPAATCNPHDVRHTPGGSSSGSAAAVADGMVPVALGSQTGGSTIRPSAYCGVVGFKPSFAAVTMAGIRPLAPSMDTIGIHARSVADVALMYPVLAGMHVRTGQPAAPRREPLRVGVYPGPHVDEADAASREALELAARRMRLHGMTVSPADLPLSLFAGLSTANRTIMAYEGARIADDDYRRGRELLGPPTLALIETGRSITDTDYDNARKLAQNCRRIFAATMLHFDLLLSFSAPGEAPVKSEGTGSSTFNRAWTTLGAPCLTLPFGHGKSGVLPLGVQLIGACGADQALLDSGALVERALDATKLNL
ncbi:amidase [Caenimonas aquaedulcis]|uniref:Amidase n=1 Tax=Caenimonas aquaedulcis TaxID=2793270 RepID=A0A931MEM0_9BURK|nr:amidase [Caenimonas aquaedulcis]MBG9386776.1 amidase [Caenimonas aquaedulcis]